MAEGQEATKVTNDLYHKLRKQRKVNLKLKGFSNVQ